MKPVIPVLPLKVRPPRTLPPGASRPTVVSTTPGSMRMKLIISRPRMASLLSWLPSITLERSAVEIWMGVTSAVTVT